MNRQEYDKHIKQMHNRREELHLKKSKDYATADVLSNFKRLSQAAYSMGLDVGDPISYALFMVVMKIDRINNLLYRDVQNESLEDSFIDAHNYLDLAYALYLEENEEIS